MELSRGDPLIFVREKLNQNFLVEVDDTRILFTFNVSFNSKNNGHTLTGNRDKNVLRHLN